jgi:hypothetical protein
MAHWRITDRSVSWLLIAAMILPFPIATLLNTRTEIDTEVAWLATSLVAVAVAWSIAHARLQRPRLWMTLAVIVAAFWPALLLIGWVVGAMA